jgi:glycosyltransferase involved in cell wall biosynthesis
LGSFHQGGSEYQAVQLVKLLCQEGSYRIYIACLNGEGILRKQIEKLGFTDVPVFPLVSFYDRNMLQQVVRCSRYIHENNISILQTHDFYTNIFGIAAGSFSKVPIRIAAKRETGMRNKAQRFVERRAFNLSHAIVVNALEVRDYLIKSGVTPDKITPIYNGFDLRRVEPRDTDRQQVLEGFGLPSGSENKFVTILANLRSIVKNHRMFLQAAEKVSEKVANVNFIIAGEGDLTDKTKSYAAELGLENRTFFIGQCTKVAELLSISDVCVLSSESEGFSNSILEYMAAAKPVVATAVGGAKEAILENENGYLVRSNDFRNMAVRLIELLENPEKAKEMGRRGRRIVEEKFSMDAQLEKTLRLYDKLQRA